MNLLKVPTVEDLRKCSLRGSCCDIEPSDERIAEMKEFLEDNGYFRSNPEVFDAIVRYGAKELEYSNVRGLFLKGDCGIGKTLGLSYLAAKFGFPMISAVDYEEAYLSKSREEFNEFVDALDFFGRPAKAIVIDDLGAESLTVTKYGTAINVMAYVLDRRYRIGFQREGCRTLIACNLSDAELRDRYGVRIDSRFDEMFDFAVVHGRSLRKHQ